MAGREEGLSMGEIIGETGEGILRLTLNRPEKKNALTRAMYAELTAALAQAKADDKVRCVVLTAAGTDFCAGNDIADFAQGAAEFASPEVEIETLPVFQFLKALTFFDKPLICALQGQAVGIGVTLLLHCDIVVAADTIRLSLPFLKLGLVPEAGSSLLLPQRIGHARAFGWMALGERIGAEDALRLGLVNRVVGPDDLAAAAHEAAVAAAGLSASSVRYTKGLMRDAESLWAVVREEGDIFRRQLTSPEARAAFAAFLGR
jgi:enoyl-CoA hydratase/carnithine racemase